MIVVTSGAAYLDIDAFAGCISYAQLLNARNIEAVPVSTATPNYSVPRVLRGGREGFRNYNAQAEDRFVLIDVSNIEHVDTFVRLEHVVEVIDHHAGFESFWEARIGDCADIEIVGSICTKIHERWVAAGCLDLMPKTTAVLMASAILDNTLNFTASITTERDVEAYRELLTHAECGDGWKEAYFQSCQEAIELDLKRSMQHDTKTVKVGAGDSFSFAQLCIWDGVEFALRNKERIEQFAGTDHDSWMVNVIGLKEARSILLVSDPGLAKILPASWSAAVRENMIQLNRAVLRKEILGGVRL